MGTDEIVKVNDDQIVTYDAPGFVYKLKIMLDIFIEQHSRCNSQFAERLIRQNISNLGLIEKVVEREKRHTTAPTWTS